MKNYNSFRAKVYSVAGDYGINDGPQRGTAIVTFFNVTNAQGDKAPYSIVVPTSGVLDELEAQIEANYAQYAARALEEDNDHARLREWFYNTEKAILFDGETLTVTEAAQLWQYYAAENNEKAAELTALIMAAKAAIRERYPNVEATQ